MAADYHHHEAFTPSSYTHEVFLSFHGGDVRTSFVDHLYHALVGRGIPTYRDEDELEKGNKISKRLSDAIQRSRIFIPILSKNYGTSKWCLQELTEMFECKRTMNQKVVPIFYKVEPSDVRNQTGQYAEAFEQHICWYSDSIVENWIKALREVASFKGWHLGEDTYEAEFIQEIVENVSDELKKLRSENYLLHLLKKLDFRVLGKIEDVLQNPTGMAFGDINLVFSPLVKVLKRLKMCATMLGDGRLQILDYRKCLDDAPLFEGLGNTLEQIASCVPEPSRFSQLSLQANERDEANHIINSIYDSSVELEIISFHLEEIVGMVESKMAGRPHEDALLQVHTYDDEMAKSELGKQKSSSMDPKVPGKGSLSEVDNTPELCKCFQGLPQHLKRCVVYSCILFGDHEFEEDTLIQLWIAVGFLGTRQQPLVESGRLYFKQLLKQSIFQRSIVYASLESAYRFHEDVYELIKQCGSNEYGYEYAIMQEGGLNVVPPLAFHSLLLLTDKIGQIDMKMFDRLYEAELLRTLKLQNESGRLIKYVPDDLFAKLRFLCVLDLSFTGIKELPTSVGELMHLRYLDVSSTRIKMLPESVSKLLTLETLKLRDCFDLVRLPNELSNLINLQYLDLDGVHQLTSMPPRMGQLANLHTLSTFIVGTEERCQIEELNCMKKLRGSLCITKMENVTKDQANEAQLSYIIGIQKLELQWSFTEDEVEMEFNLIKPHHCIEQLTITGYGAKSFPNWKWKEFWRLTSIHLRNCNCIHLPNLGGLCSLKALYIHEMHSLEAINHDSLGKFLWLIVLEINGMPCLKMWTPINTNDMPCLCELTIIDCPELDTLPEFENLKSLEHLRITLCPKIQSFPGERLPDTLRSLTITNCEKLEEQFSLENHKWDKIIGSIPEFWVGYQRISQGVPVNSQQGREDYKSTRLTIQETSGWTQCVKSDALLQKVILKIDLHDDKGKRKAMKAVTSLLGINSVSMDMMHKKMTVIGDVDPVNVVVKLREFFHTEILFVGPAKEPEKKEEPAKKEEAKKEVVRFSGKAASQGFGHSTWLEEREILGGAFLLRHFH